MDEKDLPSSSDESDADFVPKEEDYKSESGSEESDYESSGSEKKSNKGRKRKKSGKKTNKKIKAVAIEEKEDNEPEEQEEKKIDIDALWADFKKDVSSNEIKKTTQAAETKPETDTKSTGSNESSPSSEQKKLLNTKPRGVPNFMNKTKVGGLSSVLNQIGKKDKMSTLQKSQLDWNKFKKNEGIEEEIKLYNRGKDGYLDKQDFLQRTDLRQFEIEKDLRSSRRKF